MIEGPRSTVRSARDAQTHTADRTLQSEGLGPVVEQCVSVMSESHCSHAALASKPAKNTPGEMLTSGTGL